MRHHRELTTSASRCLRTPQVGDGAEHCGARDRYGRCRVASTNIWSVAARVSGEPLVTSDPRTGGAGGPRPRLHPLCGVRFVPDPGRKPRAASRRRRARLPAHLRGGRRRATQRLGDRGVHGPGVPDARRAGEPVRRARSRRRSRPRCARDLLALPSPSRGRSEGTLLRRRSPARDVAGAGCRSGTGRP